MKRSHEEWESRNDDGYDHQGGPTRWQGDDGVAGSHHITIGISQTKSASLQYPQISEESVSMVIDWCTCGAYFETEDSSVPCSTASDSCFVTENTYDPEDLEIDWSAWRDEQRRWWCSLFIKRTVWYQYARPSVFLWNKALCENSNQWSCYCRRKNINTEGYCAWNFVLELQTTDRHCCHSQSVLGKLIMNKTKVLEPFQWLSNIISTILLICWASHTYNSPRNWSFSLQFRTSRLRHLWTPDLFDWRWKISEMALNLNTTPKVIG